MHPHVCMQACVWVCVACVCAGMCVSVCMSCVCAGVCMCVLETQSGH